MCLQALLWLSWVFCWPPIGSLVAIIGFLWFSWDISRLLGLSCALLEFSWDSLGPLLRLCWDSLGAELSLEAWGTKSS